MRRRALPKDWANLRPIEIWSGFASCSRLCAFLFFSLIRLLIAAVSSSRNDFAKHEVRCLHVLRRERQRFSGLQKIGMPRVSGSLHSSLGQSKAQFLAEGFDI